MADKPYKLAYSAAAARVRCVMRLSYFAEQSQPPGDVIKLARNKLKAEQAAGKIADFETYDNEFEQFCETVFDSGLASDNPDLAVSFTIAQGSPALNGIALEPSSDEQVAFLLSFSAEPDTIKGWDFDWVKMSVKNLMREKQMDDLYNSSQLFAAWLRAGRGEAIERLAISVKPTKRQDDKPYSIIGNQARKELVLIVYKSHVFTDRDVLDSILKSAGDACKKISSQSGVSIEFLRDPLIEKMRAAMQGPERFDLNLPAVFLVGYPMEPVEDTPVAPAPEVPEAAEAAPQPAASSPEPEPTAQNEEPSQTDQDDGDYAGKGRLDIEVSDDGMEATVGSFDLSIYDQDDFDVNIEWIKKELASQGVTFGTHERFFLKVEDSLAKGEDLSGLELAAGQAPQSGKGPYLYPAYKDKREVDKGETINMRDAQQTNIVKSGDLIAEVRFKSGRTYGRDVYGNKVNSEDDEELVVSLGEGVEMREPGRYFSLGEGMPCIDDNMISVTQVLEHRGDVNLKSGNIYFDGSAEIFGAIDMGATIEVSGDLVVHGTIRGGFVRVGGNLEAKAGIVTGETGSVQVRGELRAGFIENSNIRCGYNITVKKVILNSRIFCGGEIRTPKKAGVLAGGMITSRREIHTGTLGFPNGSTTVICAGVDFRAKFKIEKLKLRRERVTAAANEVRGALREITRKKVKTKKHNEQLEEFQNRLVRMRDIIDRIGTLLQEAESTLDYDKDIEVHVHQTLHTTCQVEIGGSTVPVINEVAEVTLSGRRTKGSYIHPLAA